MGDQKNVAVLVYPGVELVDMNGPIDAFLKANYYNNGRYNVFTVSESEDEVASEADVVMIKPSYTFDNCPAPDIVVIPGQILKDGSSPGFGQGSVALLNWLRKLGADEKVTIMSVCVGAYILAKTGLLDDRKATTHYEAIKYLRDTYPKIILIYNCRFVQDGRFITTGGLTSGIDGALHLIEKLDGPVIAQHTADTLIYNRDAPLPPYTLLPPYDA